MRPTCQVEADELLLEMEGFYEQMKPEDATAHLHMRVLRCTPGSGLGSDGVDGGQSNQQCFRSIETNRCAVSRRRRRRK